MSVKLERTDNLKDNHLCLIKIGSETAEISINITISDICGAPQIFDDLNQPLKNEIATFTFYFSKCRCWLFCVGYDTHHQTAHVLQAHVLLLN